MSELPRGTVTLVFTDIEGSTRLLASLGSRYEEVLADHRRLLREALGAAGGVEVDTQGDAFFYAFARAHDAVAGAVAAQRGLASHPWPESAELRVRMGLHTGEPTVTAEGYVGSDVHLGARICAVAWGGQIVTSAATATVVSSGPAEVTLHPLGDHALKDIDERIALHQVVAPGLRSDFPPIRTLDAHPTNMPPFPTALVGRDEEVTRLAISLRDDGTRLVTLTGPGGTGKTRLALEVAHELLGHFSDGVFVIDLSPVTDASLVVAQIAAALSLKESGGRRLQETLHDYLASKAMLFVIDNFEQVMDAASEVASLLSSGPDVRVLVTSREPLRIAGEQEFAVPPLSLPSSSSPRLEEAEQSPAVALFTERARGVRADFDLTEDNVAAVIAICRRLDGLPLAIELAAARIKVLSPHGLLDRLDHSLKLLSSGRRDASERQRTLRGAIQWSYELLSEGEQRLFRRLGVFSGGWTIKAAEAVCDRGDLKLEVLDGLASLVDKSLVRGLAGDDERFSMLETIREFAVERLEESGEAEEIRRTHAEYFEGFVQQLYPNLQGPAQAATLETLEGERANFEMALQWSAIHEADLALQLASQTWGFWLTRGYLTTARRWLDQVLSLAGNASTAGARAWRGLSTVAAPQGDTETAVSAAQVAVSVSKELNDDEAMSRALVCLGGAMVDAADLGGARKYYEDSLKLDEKLGDERGVAVSFINLGYIALLEARLEEAGGLFERSLNIFEKIGDKEGSSVALGNIANARLASGDLSAATFSFRQALATAVDLWYRDAMANALEGIAAILALQDSLDQAAVVIGACETLRADTGSSREQFERTTYEETMIQLREHMPPQQLSKYLSEGEQSVDRVIHHQLRLATTSADRPKPRAG